MEPVGRAEYVVVTNLGQPFPHGREDSGAAESTTNLCAAEAVGAPSRAEPYSIGSPP